MKKIFKKWYFWVLIVFLISIISSQIGSAPTTLSEIKQTEERAKYLPELFAVDIYGNLEKLGFTCNGPKIGLDKLTSWNCEETTSDHFYLVQITGESPDKIISVQATSQYYGSGNNDTELDDFLGYVASIPYKDNTPTEATVWVKKNMGKNITTDFGSGHFELISSGRTRLLTITPRST